MMCMLPDMDECSVMDRCHVDAICNNTIGSFMCICREGYEGDGFNCMGR